MKIKRCVGVVIYKDDGKIFLMTSPKWKGHLVPGGQIKDGESEEEALRREIKEELGIEISDIFKTGESTKLPGPDFKDPELTFQFYDYFAKATQIEINPNREISSYGWFSLEEAFDLELLDSTRNLLKKYKKYTKQSR